MQALGGLLQVPWQKQVRGLWQLQLLVQNLPRQQNLPPATESVSARASVLAALIRIGSRARVRISSRARISRKQNSLKHEGAD